WNVAVGENAMALNISGSFNTAIGLTALFNNNADDNTAVGVIALGNNTTGTANAAVGKQALAVSTTGSNNTAIGEQAGFNQTTGKESPTACATSRSMRCCSTSFSKSIARTKSNNRRWNNRERPLRDCKSKLKPLPRACRK